MEPPLVRRHQAWQKGQIDYLGADSYDSFIGPVLVSAPVNRRLAWQRGEIDYLGEDSYERLIEQFINETLSMHIPDEDDDEEVDNEIDSFDW